MPNRWGKKSENLRGGFFLTHTVAYLYKFVSNFATLMVNRRRLSTSNTKPIYVINLLSILPSNITK